MFPKSVISYVIFLTLAPVCAAGTEREMPSPMIRISLAQTAVRQGSPIIARVELENLTKVPFSVFQIPGGQSGERSYTVFAFNQKNRPLAKTEYGQWLETHPQLSVSRIQRKIEPGHSLTDVIDFSKVFSFPRNGIYRLQVERESPLNEKTSIKSNIVTVEVK